MNIQDWFPLGWTGWMDWLDLLAVQGTLKSPPTPQFKSITSMALSLPDGPTLTSYVTTGKTIALTIWTFISKVVSLLANTWPEFVMAFDRQEKEAKATEPTRIISDKAGCEPMSV